VGVGLCCLRITELNGIFCRKELRRMKTFLFVVMSVIVSVNAYANSNWVFVTTSQDGAVFFIDSNSMQKSGNSITFWKMINYVQRDKYGDLSAKIQSTINCKSREDIMRYSLYYDDINNTGKLTSSGDVKDSWKPIAPDSVNWAQFQFVCK